jgi:NitT/TauT family transport system ATP-binding protein
MIAGLITPTKGEILINGKKERVNNLGYMLQKDQLLPWRTIEKNLYLPLEIKKRLTKENKDYVSSLLET